MEGHIRMMPPDVVSAVTVPMGDGERLATTMAEYGVAIVTDVLTPAECQQAEALWAQDLNAIVNKDASQAPFLDAIKADIVRGWPMLDAPLGRGGVSQYGLPHGRFAWHLRQHPRVRQCFAELFGTDELCVGLDQVFFSNDAAKGKPEDRTNLLWPHVDTNRHIEGGKWEVYQGVVYVWGSDEASSTTVVWPGSHNSAPFELCQTSTSKGHFCKLPAEHFGQFMAEAYRVPVPPGAMFLWSSRTTHQGWRAGPRLAMPVCYEPTKRRTEAARQRKVAAVTDGLPTSHWASLGLVHPNATASGGECTPDAVLKAVAHKGAIKDPAVAALL